MKRTILALTLLFSLLSSPLLAQGSQEFEKIREVFPAGEQDRGHDLLSDDPGGSPGEMKIGHFPARPGKRMNSGVRQIMRGAGV